MPVKDFSYMHFMKFMQMEIAFPSVHVQIHYGK